MRNKPTRSTHSAGAPFRFTAVAAMVLGAMLVPNNALAADLLGDSTFTSSARWAQRPSLRLARGALDTATVDGRIFVVGGFQPADPMPTVFDSVEARRVAGEGKWRPVAPMPTARGNPAAAAVDGKLYVAGGGTTDDTILDVVERFDPRTGKWATLPRMPVPRLAASAAGLGGLLYVAGGFLPPNAGNATTASVVAFDPKKGTWKAVAPMLTARDRLRLVVAGGYLYAIGGQDTAGNTVAAVERYDPRSNTWTKLASMHTSRSLFGAAVVGHGSRQFIVAVAGLHEVNGKFSFLTNTEVYDVKTGKWQVLEVQLPQGKASLVSATEADGTVLAIGGGITVNGKSTATSDVLALKIDSRDRL